MHSRPVPNTPKSLTFWRHRASATPGAALLVLLLGGFSLSHAGSLPDVQAQAGAGTEGSAVALFSSLSPDLYSGVSACESALNLSRTAAVQCYQGHLVNSLGLQRLGRFLEKRGQQRFGENFRLVNRLTYAPDNKSFDGHLDAVIPLSLFAAGPEGQTQAMFFQQGLTRWVDRSGVRRNDMRYGAMYRFAPTGKVGGDLLGIGSFVQHSLERQHVRSVTRIDYSGWWGIGSYNHYRRLTEWVPGRSGHEERALEGDELGLQLKLTTTLGLHTALARWESKSGDGDKVTNGRLGLDWRPHPWFSVRSDWGGIGEGENTRSVQLQVNVPLHSPRQRNRAEHWQGLGLAAGGSETSASDLWRPVEDIGRIEYAEREQQVATTQSLSGIGLEFLQSSAGSGAQIRVRVRLPEAATQEVRLQVRLLSGGGAHPAIAGVDFADTPVSVVIAPGSSSAEVEIQLLSNPDLQEPRTLAATLELPSA